MPSATSTSTAKLVQWTHGGAEVRYFDVYRRSDNVTASITTGDIVSKVGFGSNHYVDIAIENKPYWYWVKAISWAGKSSSFSNAITALASTAFIGEPTGFPNTTCSVITWDNGTRTLSISPSGTMFSYYLSGVKVEITAAKTCQVPNTSALSYIYFDDSTGTLISTSSYTDQQLKSIFENKAAVAAVYYNTAGTTTYFADERHGILMPGTTHSYEHFTEGLRYISGFALNTITADAAGNLDAHAQFGVDAGVDWDEDVIHSASAVAAASGLPIWYRDGASGHWVKTTNAGFSFTVGATPLPHWNEWTGATWQRTEITNTQFCLVHVFITNAQNENPVAIMGQSDYGTINLAQAGAETEVSSLILNGLPSEELHPVATVILQGNGAYANSVNARIRSTAGGDTHYDWRTQDFVPGAGPTDHGSLGGLFDDDHSQYLILNGRGGVAQHVSGDVTMGNALTISGVLSVNNAANISGALTVDGATVLKNSLAVSGVVSVNNNVNVSGALTVDGATVLKGALTASGVVTINNNANVSGNLTVDGTSVLKGTLTVSGATTINNNIAITGTATVYGATKLNSTLDVTGAATFAQGVTIASACNPLYIELTASADPPTPLTGGVIRLFAKDTAGTTVACIIDTAGTVTQIGAGAGANVALSNLDTVAINTSLVSDTNNTDDIGTSAVRWKDVYCHAVYIGTASTTTVFQSTAAGTITMTGNLRSTADVSADLGTATERFNNMYIRHLHFNATAKIEGTAAGTLTLTGTLRPTADATGSLGTQTYPFSSVCTESIYLGSSCQIQHIADSYFSFNHSLVPDAGESHSIGDAAQRWADCHIATAHFTKIHLSASGSTYGIYGVSATAIGTDCAWHVNGGLAVTGHSTFGNASVATPSVTVQIDDRYTNGAATAVYVQGRFSASSTDATTKIGIGGYATLYGNDITGTVYGLQFGPYVLGTSAGDTASTNLYGIETWAARSCYGVINAQNAFGLKINGWVVDVAATCHIGSLYNLYLTDSSPHGGTLSNQYIIYAENPTRGATRAQVVLEGATTASGVWFNGTTGQRIWGSGTGTSAVTHIKNMTNYTAGFDAVQWDTANRSLHYNASSERFKENIGDYSAEWEKLLDVKPRIWTDKETGRMGIGYIAEEVAEACPELAQWSAKDKAIKGYKERIIPMYALQIIKKQRDRINSLEERLSQLEEKVNGLVAKKDNAS